MSNSATVRVAVALACCTILISGCQPQNRTGGLLGFGSRPASGANSSWFGNGGFNGSSFGNPFAQNQQQLPQSGNAGFGQIPGGQLPGGSGTTNPFNQEYSRLSQRIGAYDADNELLNTEVATLQQKLELANQYNQTLKQNPAAHSADSTAGQDSGRTSKQAWFTAEQWAFSPNVRHRTKRVELTAV